MEELTRRWHEIRSAEPKIRIRDAAARLGVAEAALLETRLGSGVSRMEITPGALFEALARAGRVMLLVRNEAAVHEKDVVLPSPVPVGQRIAVAALGYALTLDGDAVAHVYAVDDVGPKGPLESVQLFDAAGTAVIKIYTRAGGDRDAFLALRERHAHGDQTTPSRFASAAEPARAIDHGAPPAAGLATSLAAVLQRASEAGLAVDVEVANPAARQHHRGAVKRIVLMGDWLNILDPGFDWHLNLQAVAGLAISGHVTPSLRLQDGAGADVAAFSLAEAAPASVAAWADALVHLRRSA